MGNEDTTARESVQGDGAEIAATSLRDWLEGSVSTAHHGNYRHRRLDERLELRPQVLDSLKEFVHAAHEDARRHIRSLAGISLDPLDGSPSVDPAAGYPSQLHEVTLKGYLGEVLAGLMCEHFGPHGDDRWEVPAYLFRFHDVAFNQLETIRQTGGAATIIPGRVGNDCLAFVRDDDGALTRTLFCEAKCTADHDRGLVVKAHEQLSDSLLVPSDLRQMVDVLNDQGGAEASNWVEALRQLWLEGPEGDYERCDLVTYACGRSPRNKASWIAAGTPETSYTGGRRLEAIEIHLGDVPRLIEEVYGE